MQLTSNSNISFYNFSVSNNIGSGSEEIIFSYLFFIILGMITIFSNNQIFFQSFLFINNNATGNWFFKNNTTWFFWKVNVFWYSTLNNNISIRSLNFSLNSALKNGKFNVYLPFIKWKIFRIFLFRKYTSVVGRKFNFHPK